MPERPSIIELARRIADTLEEDGIPYAIGGAIACGYWAPPRATVDIDLNLFVDEAEWETALEALRRGGCCIDSSEAIAALKERGDFRTTASGYRVDVFTPSFDFYGCAGQRKVKRPLAGRPAWILSAEDLVVFKMLYFRGKDIEDVRRILLLQAQEFDREYVSSWLERLVGKEDERIKRWLSLLADPSAG